ncbi:rhomboid family intramembrane serine protease [Mycolicibacterium thermoresistibile]
MSMPSTPHVPAGTPTCYRHPDRTTYVRCTRCGRYICPECMRAAAVGHQCVECVAAAARTVRRPTTPFGGRISTGPPVLTYTLIAVNVLMYVLQRASTGFTEAFVLWAPAVAAGEYYRLVTSAFLHFGLMHLLFNMFALYVIGGPLEAALGRLRFGLLYALSALGGSVLVYLLAMNPTAGASGAVFGLFAATYVVAKRLNLDVRFVTGLIVVNLVITFVVPGISWQGHLGGLLTGALVAAAFAYPPPARRNAVQAATVVTLVLLFAVLIWVRTDVLLGTWMTHF